MCVPERTTPPSHTHKLSHTDTHTHTHTYTHTHTHTYTHNLERERIGTHERGSLRASRVKGSLTSLSYAQALMLTLDLRQQLIRV
jgi:hypothetical protein